MIKWVSCLKRRVVPLRPMHGTSSSHTWETLFPCVGKTHTIRRLMSLLVATRSDSRYLKHSPYPFHFSFYFKQSLQRRANMKIGRETRFPTYLIKGKIRSVSMISSLSKHFISCPYTGCPKNVYLCSCYWSFVAKTKVTIWADSTIMESALSFFLLKLLADSNNW